MTLKKWENEDLVVFTVSSKSNSFIFCVTLYGILLSLGFDYSICGTYWSKAAVARTFIRVSKQLLEEEQSV